MTKVTMIKVVLVDDHPVVREGLAAMLSTESDIDVVGQAGTGQEALAIIPKLRPTVVLMDLLLPDIGGAEVIQRIAEFSAEIRCIVLTSLGGDEDIYRALEAGARGYLLKDTARKDLVQAIRTVSVGQRFIPNQVGSTIAENYPRTDLSSREVEVLKHMAVGERNKEIAHSMGLNEATVAAHVRHIFEKLHASDRTQAVTVALKRGVIRL